MIVYHYHPETGVLLGSEAAFESPLEPGVYLIPAYATAEAPPATEGDDCPAFIDGAWQVCTPPVLAGIDAADDYTSALQVGGAIVHGADNAWAYGSAARRGTTIYLATNPVVGSDARLKCDYSVIPGDIAHELLLKIVPRVGKFIVGGQEAYGVEVATTNEAGEEVTQKVTRYREVPGNRYPTYYLAQEVKAALDSVADRWPQASNFALWLLSDVEDVDSIQMIRYEQMIPIIHAASNYRYGALA